LEGEQLGKYSLNIWGEDDNEKQLRNFVVKNKGCCMVPVVHATGRKKKEKEKKDGIPIEYLLYLNHQVSLKSCNNHSREQGNSGYVPLFNKGMWD
jgi:hypothetical protein